MMSPFHLNVGSENLINCPAAPEPAIVIEGLAIGCGRVVRGSGPPHRRRIGM